MPKPESQEIDERIARIAQQDERLIQALELLAERRPRTAKTGRDWDAYAAVIASLIGMLALTPDPDGSEAPGRAPRALGSPGRRRGTTLRGEGDERSIDQRLTYLPAACR